LLRQSTIASVYYRLGGTLGGADILSELREEHADMPESLFLNGVYEDTLKEIEQVQKESPGTFCYLQPYDTDRIVLLAEQCPGHENPIRVYISLTTSLNVVSYEAWIVGWQDKRKMDQATLEAAKTRISKYQKSEKEGIYKEGNGGKECVNLISVDRLRRVAKPFSVSLLKKTKDGTPLKDRTQAGKWSYVEELPSESSTHAEA
jgi:hypothetical protein